MTTQNLTGKTVLVTGASRGIGAAIADTLAQAGATVIGTATSESGAAAIGERLAQWNGHGRTLNAADEQGVETLIADIEKEERNKKYGKKRISGNGVSRRNEHK